MAADPAWARSGGRALSVAPLLAAQTMVQEELLRRHVHDTSTTCPRHAPQVQEELLHRLARGASVGRLSLTRDALRRVRAQLARSGQERL